MVATHAYFPPVVQHRDRMQATVPKLETRLPIEFDGPGLYLLPNETILIVPRDPQRFPLWEKEQPPHPGTVYEAYVWDRPFEDTLIGCLHGPNSTIPIRSDIR